MFTFQFLNDKIEGEKNQIFRNQVVFEKVPIIRERTFSVEALEEKVVEATNPEIDQVIFNSLSFEKETLVQNLPKIFAQTCQEGQVVNDQVYFNDLQISKETIKEAPC